MNNFTKQSVAVLAVAVVAVAAWFLFTKSSGQELSQSATNIQYESADVAGGTVSYKGREGMSALKLLEQSYQVETEDASGRLVVNAIGGKANNDVYAWKLYINGQLVSVDADQYISQDSDVIEWKYEKPK